MNLSNFLHEVRAAINIQQSKGSKLTQVRDGLEKILVLGL